MVLVVEQSADASAKQASNAPRGKKHSVVDANVLRAPEISCSGGVHRELRSVAPVDNEQHDEQGDDIAADKIQNRHGSHRDSDHKTQDIDATQMIGHETRENAAGGIAHGADYKTERGQRSAGVPTLLAKGNNWLMTMSPAAQPHAYPTHIK